MGVVGNCLKRTNKESGQIIATSHDLGLRNVAEEGKSPYFRAIQAGEIS